MAGHIFGSDNLLDNAQLSMITGTENAQFPLDNIKTPITSKVFSASGGTVEFMIDTGTFLPVDTFMVVGDNIEGIGFETCKIYGSTTDNFTGATEIVIDISSENNFGFKQFTESNFRYWKVTLTGSAYCEMSNIFIGKSVVFATNAIDLGSFRYTDKENLKVNKNKYGNKFINTYNTQRTLRGSLKLLNTTEYNTIREIWLNHKKSIPLWFITDPTDYLETDAKYIYSGFFYMETDVDFKNTNPKLWSTGINFKEVV